MHKLGVHILKILNLFDFGGKSCTEMKRPAELVQPATAWLSKRVALPALLQQNSESYFKSINSLPEEKIAGPRNSNLFQLSVTAVPSLKPPSRTHSTDSFLSPSSGSTFACGLSLNFISRHLHATTTKNVSLKQVQR